jgi:uncharacterized protein (TIGR02147 family)
MQDAPHTPDRPVVADYTDYRAYLRDMLAHLKATQRRFSYRFFSKKAGYASPNFLKLVIDGQRNLSLDSIERFARALDLTEAEGRTFQALVLLGQARTDEERNRCYAQLQAGSAVSTRTTAIERAQYEVYSLWYALPIREMMLWPSFQEDPEWIARRLRPRIRPSEAARAMALLEKTGLVGRNERGALEPRDGKLATPSTVTSLAVRNYHRALLGLAAQALDGVPVDQRNVTSLTVILTPELYTEVCQRIADFRQALLDYVDDPTHVKTRGEVSVIGFQVFPLAREDWT